ncbi:MAG: hypothetical protein AVDCRST_MAG68-979, partial [uncultured Gemmatimonadetes bacterium]
AAHPPHVVRGDPGRRVQDLPQPLRPALPLGPHLVRAVRADRRGRRHGGGRGPDHRRAGGRRNDHGHLHPAHGAGLRRVVGERHLPCLRGVPWAPGDAGRGARPRPVAGDSALRGAAHGGLPDRPGLHLLHHPRLHRHGDVLRRGPGGGGGEPWAGGGAGPLARAGARVAGSHPGDRDRGGADRLAPQLRRERVLDGEHGGQRRRAVDGGADRHAGAQPAPVGPGGAVLHHGRGAAVLRPPHPLRRAGRADDGRGDPGLRL